MSWEFANPAMLWGTSLAAVPLIVHLFNRKRAREHDFAAIDFVLRSRRRTSRRLRLKRLLLFLVRTLLLLLVPLALARPQQKREAAAGSPSGPAATAIVLDTSLSMGYLRDGSPLLERARQMAREKLSDLAPEDPVTFVGCEEGAPPPAAPGFDRGRVRELLDGARQTYQAQDLTACIGRAARALGESTIPAKRIVVATDLTASSFRLDVPPPTVLTPQGEVRPEVVVLDAAGGAKELPNAAVTALRVEPAVAVGHRAFQFSVTVSNFSSRPLQDLQASVRVGKEVVAKGFLDVPARGTAVKALTYRFPEGGFYSGSVEISQDSLVADDARHWALRVPKDIKALVVDGAPHPVRFLDEAFFVQAALEAPGSPVKATLRDAETAAAEDLSDYDLVLLLNVRELPAPKVAQLDQLVQKGGGLFLSLGDQVDPDAYAATFGALLPRALHLAKTAAVRGEEGAERKAARLAQVAFDHPALSVFTGEAREGVLSARTYRYFLLQPSGPAPATALATFDDGAPALIEARHGKGRVALFTTTVDRDWTDWPIRTSFLPMMQRLAAWLAGALDERALESLLVGQDRQVEAPPGASGLRFKGPDGKDLEPSSDPQGRLVLARLAVPGVYRAQGKLAGAEAAIPDLDFAVNVDPRESDLGRLEEPELKAYFGEKTRTEQRSGQDDAPPSFPVWSILLAAGIGLFLSEGLLLRK